MVRHEKTQTDTAMTATGTPNQDQSLIEKIFYEVFDQAEASRAETIERLAQGNETLAERVKARLLEYDRAVEKISPAFEFEFHTGRSHDLSGHQIGAYRLVEPLGPGGMGDVYLAERCDDQYEQTVAIKLVRNRPDADGSHEWFARERMMLAMLEHPCIARLLDAGIYEDRPYVVLEYVEGDAIDNYCCEQTLTLEERLTLFLDVLDTVHFAHQRIVTHRDLKPQNILVTANGVVKLVDFGIGNIASEDTPDLVQKYGLRLTPNYAAPEQWRGNAHTTAVDIYALGVVLFKLLSGDKPYTAEQIEQFVETDTWPAQPPPMRRALMRSSEPDTLAKRRRLSLPELQRQLEGELEAIIGKAMRPDPDQRYGSSREFARDIRHYLSGQPVEAFSDQKAYRARKWIKRNPWPVAAASLVTVFLGGSAVYQKHVAEQEAELARAVAFEREQANTLSRLLFEVFESAAPARADGNSITVREAINTHGREVLGKLGPVRDLAARFAGAIGIMLSDLHSYHDAEYFLHRARDLLNELALERSLTRDEREMRAQTMLALGATYVGLAKYDDAMAVAPVTERAILDWNKEAHDLLLGLMNTQTTTLTGMNRLDEAQLAAKEAVEFARQHPNTRATTRALALNNQAVAHRRDSTMEGAIETLNEARNVLADLPGHHPLHAAVLANLGGAFYQARKFPEAAALYREVIDMQEQSKMADNIMHAQAEYGLGIIHMRNGAYDQSLPHLQRASALQQKLRSAYDIDSWRVDFALATAHDALGQLDIAKDRYESLAKTTAESLDDAHLVGRVMLRLAALAVDEERFDDAHSLLQRPESTALASARSSSGLLHEAAAATSQVPASSSAASRVAEIHAELLNQFGPHALPTQKTRDWKTRLAAAQ